MCILQRFFCGIFFFFFGKEDIARGQQHCYPVGCKSSSQIVLRSWGSADGENQQICGVTLDSFTPSLIICRTQRFKQMLVR